MTLQIGKDVPWNAAWSGEDRHEVRPCRFAAGELAVWQSFKPGEGRPIFAAPHMVRQRRSIAELRCTVCGERTAESDRWWFPIGSWRHGWWVSTESPVHLKCADLAAHACPFLRTKGVAPIRMPEGWSILAALVAGEGLERDFGIRVNGRRIIGHLKLAWRRPAFPEAILTRGA